MLLHEGQPVKFPDGALTVTLRAGQFMNIRTWTAVCAVCGWTAAEQFTESDAANAYLNHLTTPLPIP